MSIRAVLFDLDGTLADTAPDLARALNRLLVEREHAPITVERARPFTSSGARGMIGVGFGISPEADEAQEYVALKDRFLALYADGLCVETTLFDGMPELLTSLEERGIAWGVVTNKAARFTDPLIAQLGLRDRAACVVSGDTTPRAKPFPDPLLHAAREINIPVPECLYVGDDLRDVQAARAAGMPVLAAGYGYLGGGEPPQAWGADATIQHPREVLDYL